MRQGASRPLLSMERYCLIVKVAFAETEQRRDSECTDCSLKWVETSSKVNELSDFNFVKHDHVTKSIVLLENQAESIMISLG